MSVGNDPKQEIEHQSEFEIRPPVDGDEVGIGPMQVQAWREAYLHPEIGVTDDAIQDAIAFVATEDGDNHRKGVFMETREKPNDVLYRVVKDRRGKVVGFMHAMKHETTNELGGIYLLNVVKGKGIGDKLMAEFLDWIDKTKPTTLQVIAFNDRALLFYQKYGFSKTDTHLEPFKVKFPLVEMVRPKEQPNA